MRVVANVVVLGAAFGLTGACGDEVDLTGVYEVDAVLASAPCGDDEPVTGGPAYLKFSRGELFGAPYYSYADCTDETASECASAGGLFEGFFEPIDGGWLGHTTFASTTGLNCTLSMTDKTAILDGARLTVEIHHYQTQIELANEDCTPDEADRRGAEMPCAQHHLVEATRL